ncbi:Fpg/Nei family DNA glycosylase [Nanchangia anserum]|uniref:DNA-(apurinic or apyrimidinic site) lyase n=1 Tax=Nanchangia anserum TaxID=2692125 RepID=A0A8I0KQX7_9ACTO|nr:Fpg/Nei family DNA glycosylase [Nanchangia anserum]MBD3688882.1 Fpg/Nei family DNA glycosylase [Nanchangia anserum]QOX81149.1 Fpg/Nei family DNA glycosylase [Nanchangia anserum]
MPEGHSIHRLAHTFAAIGDDLRPRASSPQGRFAASAAVIDGQHLRRTWAWGKHLFLDYALAGDHIVHVHLGLYGSWRFVGTDAFVAPSHVGAPRLAYEHLGEKVERVAGAWQPPEPRPTVRLRLEFPHGIADLSGPARCELIDDGEVDAILNRLGPDPLRADCDGEDFVRAARSSRRPIGQLVMDQSVVAGPGNIYRAECLFRTGISPWRPGERVSVDRLRALYADLCTTMSAGVREGRIVTIEPADILDPLPDPEAGRFYVYHRDQRACVRCGHRIVAEDMAGRRLFRCPGCQH